MIEVARIPDATVCVNISKTLEAGIEVRVKICHMAHVGFGLYIIVITILDVRVKISLD